MRVEIDSDSPVLLTCALREFPEPGSVPVSQDQEEERGVVRIDFAPRLGEVPAPNALQPGSHGLKFQLGGATVWLETERGALARVDLRRRGVTLSVSDPAATPERDVAALLGIALPYLYRELGLFPVHTSAVLADRTPILLAGPSGSGKSTTAALLVRSGMTWLADDLVLLEPRADFVSLRGIARRPRLDAQALARLTGCEPSPVGPLSASDRGLPLDKGNQAVLLFPCIQGATACRLQALTRPEALDELVRCSLLMGERSSTAGHLRALASLVENSRAFRLHLSEEVRELPTLIRSLLKSHA